MSHLHNYRTVSVELMADADGRMTGMAWMHMRCEECLKTISREVTASSAPRRAGIAFTVTTPTVYSRPATSDDYAAALLAADSVPL